MHAGHMLTCHMYVSLRWSAWNSGPDQSGPSQPSLFANEAHLESVSLHLSSEEIRC